MNDQYCYFLFVLTNYLDFIYILQLETILSDVYSFQKCISRNVTRVHLIRKHVVNMSADLSIPTKITVNCRLLFFNYTDLTFLCCLAKVSSLSLSPNTSQLSHADTLSWRRHVFLVFVIDEQNVYY